MPTTKSKIRGVPMQDWQVRSLLAGTMSQFRMPVKNKRGGVITGISPDGLPIESYGGGRWHVASRMEVRDSPYQPGEVLFIKETWGIHRLYDADYSAGVHIGRGFIHYRADGASPPVDRWRPPQHLRAIHARPERIKITSVGAGLRIRISEEDALACGIQHQRTDTFGNKWYGVGSQVLFDKRGDPIFEVCPIHAFKRLWDAQHHKRNGWAENGYDWSFRF